MSGTRSNTAGLNEPFLLKPAYKDYLWGGDALKKEYGKDTDCTPLAESWECSTHPDGPSTVDSGAFKGIPLSDLVQRYPDLLGTHPARKGELPVLIKFIDAKQDLSVQVHPDDDYARIHEHGSLGKNEMWYVLSAGPDAQIIYGFAHDTEKEEIQAALQEGTLMKHVRRIPVRTNDVFFIPAGTVHAIGRGTVVAEIQESSNLTYRMYDYDRTDDQGRKRELHTDKALEVLDYHGTDDVRQPMRVLRYRPGCASELLVRCRYFQTERILLNSPGGIEQKTDSASFEVLLCVEGSGELCWENSRIAFRKGQCIFVPADSVDMKLCGKAQLLKVRC
ncbi:MAG: mannose-6-phosphate isomerase, class I [Solobacterium sp.]|nr:mannose-6-phosphate isomerase, class I [Solobacterium sp.]